MEIPATDVAGFVRRLAEEAGISSSRDLYSEIADVFSALSDKDIESDQTQDLIIMLSRKKVISSEDGWLLYRAYLNESTSSNPSDDGTGSGYQCMISTPADREHSRIRTAMRTGNKG